MRARARERRRPGRPQNGDVKPCPRCGADSFEFSDRYRFEGAVVAAWVCDAPGCKHRQIVRGQPKNLIAESREVQARARRAMMKSRAKQERAEIQIANTERRVRKR